MKKIIYVTGCSHTAGAELTDNLIFDDYESHIRRFSNLKDKHNPDRITPDLFDIISKKRIKYLLQKYSNKKFHRLMGIDQKKVGDTAKRYFERMEKRLSWPAKLQVLLPKFEIVNLSKSGSSFKYNVKKALDILGSSMEQLIMIHQIPAFGRTYVKFQNKIYDQTYIKNTVLKKINGKSLSNIEQEIQKRYKKLIVRDVDNGYFRRSTEKYINCLYKKSYPGVRNYFILENKEVSEFLPRDSIIIDDFPELRSRFKQGVSHVIDQNFHNVLAKMVFDKINLV